MSNGALKSFFQEVFGDPRTWLFTGIAVLAAAYISHLSSFQRINSVVSDEISRAIGATSKGPVVLIRVERDFSKAQFQQLLSRAIPALMDNYGVATLGVDIDFTDAGYGDLAKNFTAWSAGSRTAANVVWAIKYVRGPKAAPENAGPELCSDCSSQKCTSRFQPLPVFGAGNEPPNYGLAYAWADSSGITRSSFRFACQNDTTAPLNTFHFQLVENYCHQNPTAYLCEPLQPNRQSATVLHTWYEAENLDLCDLVKCEGDDLGAPPLQPSNALSNKLAILYVDVEGNDEHATLGGTRKGAEVVASLVMNEMLYGAVDESATERYKFALEAIVTLLLLTLFGWKRTEHWAVLIAGLLFVLYLYVVRRLAVGIPDFRDYALGLLLAFAIEVWLKAAVHSLRSPSHSNASATATGAPQPPPAPQQMTPPAQ